MTWELPIAGIFRNLLCLVCLHHEYFLSVALIMIIYNLFGSTWQEWERPKPGRRPDIFPQFSPMKTPLPPPLPYDPPEEDEEDEEKKEEEEEDPEREEPDQPDKQ